MSRSCYNCPYRTTYFEDYYEYTGCKLKPDFHGYGDCDVTASYCKLNKMTDDEYKKLIKDKEDEKKKEQIERLKIDIEWKEEQIIIIQEEIEELYEEIERIKLGVNI